MSQATKRWKVPCSQLQLGMYVAELDRPWKNSPFTVEGFTLRSAKEIAALQAHCQFVYIEQRQAAVDTNGSQYKRRTYDEPIPFGQEIKRAQSIHAHAKEVVDGLFSQLRLGNSIDTRAAKQVVRGCTQSIINNPSALLWLSLIKNQDHYTCEHSLNVCMLSIALGRELGLMEADLEHLGLSALLHDVGKAKVPNEILNKEGALSEHEFEIMKRHTTYGMRLLMGQSSLFHGAVDVAHNHHERLNGRGYPRGLQSHQIGYFSRIVAITDSYDAITSNRIYSRARSSLDALRILSAARGTHYDPELVDAFIRSIGLYPAGSIAELSNGEIGLVLPTPRAFQNSPRLLIVRDSRKNPCTERVVDLHRQAQDTSGTPLQIRTLLSNGVFGIDLRSYHAKGLRLTA